MRPSMSPVVMLFSSLIKHSCYYGSILPQLKAFDCIQLLPMKIDLIRLFLRMVRQTIYSLPGGCMSSHREAPAISSLSAFVGLPTLASAQVGTAFAFDALEQVDQPAAKDWHVNLNITDFYVFQKPGDTRKTILIMNVNPMP